MKCYITDCKKKVSEYKDVACVYCTHLYCRNHRLPFDHICNNTKLIALHTEKITKQNPVIIVDKMEYRL